MLRAPRVRAPLTIVAYSPVGTPRGRLPASTTRSPVETPDRSRSAAALGESLGQRVADTVDDRGTAAGLGDDDVGPGMATQRHDVEHRSPRGRARVRARRRHARQRR